MATLTSKDGTSVSLTIIGYQAPNATDPYDTEWLNIKLDVTVKDGLSWTAIDPALETGNVDFICDWLRRIANGLKHDQKIWFTEPCLEISRKGKGKKIKKLDFKFGYEFAPGRKTQIVFIETTPKEIEFFAEELRKELEKYPSRHLGGIRVAKERRAAFAEELEIYSKK
jgi:hypothetical protein